jgi:hypothetical protein
MKLKSILTLVRRRAPVTLLPAALVLLLGPCADRAEGAAPDSETLPQITVEHGRFEPSELVVPANTAFKLRVTNKDSATIEFESFELHRERAVEPGETITVFMPSLSPGSYKFVDDFHSDTPEGVIVAR